MSRKKSREYVFRMVFEKFFHDEHYELFDEASDDIILDEVDREFANSLISGVNEHYDEIISIVKENIVGYEIDRVFKIDLAILVLAVYELKFSQEQIDSHIIINEAVELCKKYSTEKSYSFVNGVLAKVIR